MPIHQLLFKLMNAWVMPFWLLMIVAPRWRWTRQIMASWVPALVPALAYAVLLVWGIVQGGGEGMEAVAQPELAALAQLFGAPEAVATAWLHFLAFDLFVGTWIYLDSRQRALEPYSMAVILFFTLMTGPLGLLLYFLRRRLARA